MLARMGGGTSRHVVLALPAWPFALVRILKLSVAACERPAAGESRRRVVYCVEGVDHGGAVRNLRPPPDAELVAEHRPDLLGDSPGSTR